MSFGRPQVPVEASGVTIPGLRDWIRRVAGAVNALAVNAAEGASPGDLKPYAGITPPTGWLVCDGTEISRNDYRTLFQAIGTTWGAGNGSTTFNIPDLRDRLLVGVGILALSATAGAETVTLTVGNLPEHGHGITDPGHTHVFTGTPHSHSITDPGHDHDITDPGHDHAGGFVDAAAGTEYDGTAKGTAGNSVATNTTGISVDTNTTGITVDAATAAGTNGTSMTGITVNTTGAGEPVNILPPVAGVYWLIKV